MSLPFGWKTPHVDHSQMKLGKGPARKDNRTLAMAKYTSSLAPAPPECNFTSSLKNLGAMLNDTLGDCTCAAVGHCIQFWTTDRKCAVIIPDSDILSLYEKVGGYVPGNPSTDQGAVELDVLNYWKANPVDGHVLSAYVAINPLSNQELMDAVYYFGCAYIGVLLPISCQTQEIWDVVSGSDGDPGSWGGHAIPIVAYDKDYVYCITWGQIKKMTRAFYTKYCDEAYALLSPDWTDQGNSIDGFDIATLLIDLGEISKA